jgi:hypothetical protein
MSVSHFALNGGSHQLEILQSKWRCREFEHSLTANENTEFMIISAMFRVMPEYRCRAILWLFLYLILSHPILSYRDPEIPTTISRAGGIFGFCPWEKAYKDIVILCESISSTIMQ